MGLTLIETSKSDIFESKAHSTILLKKGKIYLVEEMWWNHLDSTPH